MGGVEVRRWVIVPVDRDRDAPERRHSRHDEPSSPSSHLRIRAIRKLWTTGWRIHAAA
jgi:hypothetical protein